MLPCQALDATPASTAADDGAPPVGPAPRRALAILFFTIFIDLLGFGILIPVMPTYARRYGASETVIGLLFATYSIAQLIAAPLWGRLSDRIGRRPVIVVAAAGSAVAYLCFGLADHLWMLFVARLIVGGCGGTISTAQAYIADVTAPEQRTRGMALVGAAIGLGFTIGPALSGLIASQGGVRAPFFVGAGLAAANAIWAAIALPEPAVRRAAARGPLISSLTRSIVLPGVGFYLGLLFVVTYAFAHIETTLVLWTTDLLGFTERDNGLLFMWIGIVLVIAQMGGTRRLAKSVSEPVLAATGCALMALGALATPLVGAWPLLAVTCAIIALGSALNSPAIMSAISRAAPAESQGELLGVSQSVSALGRIAGPPACGLLYQFVGRSAPWITSGVLLALGAVAVSARAGLRRNTPTAR